MFHPLCHTQTLKDQFKFVTFLVRMLLNMHHIMHIHTVNKSVPVLLSFGCFFYFELFFLCGVFFFFFFFFSSFVCECVLVFPHPLLPGPVTPAALPLWEVIMSANTHTKKLHTNLISWHVNCLNNPVKWKKVLQHLQYLEAGIAFLQETHLRTLDHFRIRKGWVGQLS